MGAFSQHRFKKFPKNYLFTPAKRSLLYADNALSIISVTCSSAPTFFAIDNT